MKNDGGKNSSGVASVVLGILSVLLFFSGPIAFTLAIISLVFAIVQFKAGKNKWAVWGLVLSIIGLILSGLVFYVVILIGSRMTEMYQTIASCKIDPSLPQCAELMNALAPNLQAQLAGAGLA